MRKTPATLGVLSMVFGGLVGLYSLIGVVFSTVSGAFFGMLLAQGRALPPQPGHPDPALLLGRMQEMMKAIAPYTDALLAAKIVFSVALLAIGYGLYQRRRWSRSGALAWSALALVELAVEVIVRMGVIQPRVDAAVSEWLANAHDPAVAAMLRTIGNTQSVVTVLLYAPFPLVMLALFGRRSAAADFVD
jgi:hypothetical protein